MTLDIEPLKHPQVLINFNKYKYLFTMHCDRLMCFCIYYVIYVLVLCCLYCNVIYTGWNIQMEWIRYLSLHWLEKWINYWNIVTICHHGTIGMLDKNQLILGRTLFYSKNGTGTNNGFLTVSKQNFSILPMESKWSD